MVKKSTLEKDVILDGYLGVFSTAKAPMKITFLKSSE
jgi:hypothetical protein